MDKRWIEIKFVYFCLSLYDNLRDYIATTNYIELLADMIRVDKNKALRLLQKTNQLNTIRPTKTEFVIKARKNKVTINKIIKILNISKTEYIELTHKNIDVPKNCISSDDEIQLMVKLLEAHDKFKGTGL